MSFCAKPKGEVAESKNKEHKPLTSVKRLEQTRSEGPGGSTIEQTHQILGSAWLPLLCIEPNEGSYQQTPIKVNLENRIYVAGHRGLAGSAILRALQGKGFQNLITRTREELDLTDAEATRRFFEQERPQYVFLAAAKVGGIHSNNTFPAEFLRENLLIQTHVLHESWRVDVKKLLFLGSSCIYPRLAPQPIPESALLTGELESTNNAYAVAKIAGIQACQAYRKQHGSNFIAAMPTNLFGPHDNFHPSTHTSSCPDPTFSRGAARRPPRGHRVGQWNATPRVPLQ